MTDPEKVRFSIRRIVVALDTSPHAQAALETAARIAARLEAEVEGLFVEDINLLNLSDLSIGREVRRLSGEARKFDRPALEGEFRAEAARLRRTFETLLRGRHLRGGFRVVRGRVDVEVVTAAEGADLLILGIESHRTRRSGPPGSTALAAAIRARGSVLLLRSAAPTVDRGIAVFDGSPGAIRALEAAADIVEDKEGELVVVLAGATDEENDKLEAAARKALPAGEFRTATFRRGVPIELSALCGLVHETAAGALVIAGDNPLLTKDGHGSLLETLGCPLLIVR